MNRALRNVVMVAGLTAMAGCVSSTIQEVREARTSMDVDDYMVVLGKRDRPNSNETELNFISCISKNIASGSDALNVIDERAFMDSMFPWFEPRTAPVETGDLPRIMNQPLLAERLDEIGIKYLVWVEGSTERTDSAASASRSASAAAPPGSSRSAAITVSASRARADSGAGAGAISESVSAGRCRTRPLDRTPGGSTGTRSCAQRSGPRRRWCPCRRWPTACR